MPSTSFPFPHHSSPETKDRPSGTQNAFSPTAIFKYTVLLTEKDYLNEKVIFTANKAKNIVLSLLPFSQIWKIGGGGQVGGKQPELPFFSK